MAIRLAAVLGSMVALARYVLSTEDLGRQDGSDSPAAGWRSGFIAWLLEREPLEAAGGVPGERGGGEDRDG